MVAAALSYRAQVPVLDSLLRELNLDGDKPLSQTLGRAFAEAQRTAGGLDAGEGDEAANATKQATADGPEGPQQPPTE